ncbi:hypothetical protein AMECASPLE_003239 [Ameca splendens]|uniref:Uncharacterized protein n=1 Tax=Ameca splendens TaxID=208324 RepID=A0ABV0XMT3_9TELE
MVSSTLAEGHIITRWLKGRREEEEQEEKEKGRSDGVQKDADVLRLWPPGFPVLWRNQPLHQIKSLRNDPAARDETVSGQ